MITITEQAAAQIKRSLQKRGKGVGIRIGVKTTGCSGLAYVLEYVDSPSTDDVQYNSCDTCIFVDPKSCAYLQGLTIGWARNGLNQGFDFINPNERDRCGCGESFRI